MALADRVKERFSNDKRLRQLTNPEDASPSSINDTFLGVVCDDIEGEFITLQVGTYDETNKQHVGLACDGVVAQLEMRINPSDGTRATYEAWRSRAREAGRSGMRSTIDPQIGDADHDSYFRGDSFDPVTLNKPRGHRRRIL